MKKYKQVLARRDKNGPYGPDNCYFRKPANDKEREMGMEMLNPMEPIKIPLTLQDMRTLKEAKDKQLAMIFIRMHWRAENYGDKGMRL